MAAEPEPFSQEQAELVQPLADAAAAVCDAIVREAPGGPSSTALCNAELLAALLTLAVRVLRLCSKAACLLAAQLQASSHTQAEQPEAHSQQVRASKAASMLVDQLQGESQPQPEQPEEHDPLLACTGLEQVQARGTPAESSSDAAAPSLPSCEQPWPPVSAIEVDPGHTGCKQALLAPCQPAGSLDQSRAGLLAGSSARRDPRRPPRDPGKAAASPSLAGDQTPASSHAAAASSADAGQVQHQQHLPQSDIPQPGSEQALDILPASTNSTPAQSACFRTHLLQEQPLSAAVSGSRDPRRRPASSCWQQAQVSAPDSQAAPADSPGGGRQQPPLSNPALLRPDSPVTCDPTQAICSVASVPIRQPKVEPGCGSSVLLRPDSPATCGPTQATGSAVSVPIYQPKVEPGSDSQVCQAPMQDAWNAQPTGQHCRAAQPALRRLCRLSQIALPPLSWRRASEAVQPGGSSVKLVMPDAPCPPPGRAMLTHAKQILHSVCAWMPLCRSIGVGSSCGTAWRMA